MVQRTGFARIRQKRTCHSGIESSLVPLCPIVGRLLITRPPVHSFPDVSDEPGWYD